MEKEEELFIPKTKHKGLKIILAILLIAGLVTGGYFLYQYKFNNPKVIVNKVLEQAKGNIKEMFNESESNDKYKIDGHIKVDTNIDDDTFKILKDIELQVNGEISTNDSIANLSINSKYKSDKLLNLKLYMEKEIAYVLLEDIYDKYIKIDTKANEEILSSSVSINQKDAEKLYELLIDALKKELNEYEFKKEETTITIDGNNVKVIDNYLELKDKEVNNLAKNLINDLKDNQTFIDIINSLTEGKGKEFIDNLLEEIKEEYHGTYRIDFYTNKGILNKKLVSVRQSISQSGATVSINVDKVSDDEIIISLASMGVAYSVKIKKNNSAVNLLLNMTVFGQYINVEVNMNYEKIKEITKPDVSNNKDINSITEKEMDDIEKKLMENKTLLKLINELSGTTQKEA